MAQGETNLLQMQIFNQINARKIKDEYNPFGGLGRGAAFVYILLIEVVLQVRPICSAKPTVFSTQSVYVYVSRSCGDKRLPAHTVGTVDSWL